MSGLDQYQERIWWIEHQIRSIIAAHPMKVGKAIRRVLPAIKDAELQALSSLWSEGSFNVSLSDSPAVFVEAYQSVRSCMYGKGALCRRAYAPHGIGIAVARRGGELVARALVRDTGAFNRCYGSAHYALDAVLRLVAGLDCGPHWLDGIAGIRAEALLWQKTYPMQIMGRSHTVEVYRRVTVFEPFLDVA